MSPASNKSVWMQNKAAIPHKGASVIRNNNKLNKTHVVNLRGDIFTYISAKNEETTLFYVRGHSPISIFIAGKDLFRSHCLF